LVLVSQQAGERRFGPRQREFCLVKPVDPNDPAVADTIADWEGKQGTVGIPVLMRDDVSTDPANPGLNRVLAAAAKSGNPGLNRVLAAAAKSGNAASRSTNEALDRFVEKPVGYVGLVCWAIATIAVREARRMAHEVLNRAAALRAGTSRLAPSATRRCANRGMNSATGWSQHNNPASTRMARWPLPARTASTDALPPRRSLLHRRHRSCCA
jgi:hypothetical protein